MMVEAFCKRTAQGIAPAALIGFLLALTGCQDTGYPTSLTYPPRTDLLVVKTPTKESVNTDAPGQLDRAIALIKTKDGETLDPKDLDAKSRQELTQELHRVFGTPASPKVLDFDDDETKEAIGELGLDSESLAKGSRYYRRHCLHCHGVAGDGRGPAGAWLNPHPRDYRQGKFKFMSSKDGGKPRRADLHRTIYNGIESTSMPAFNTIGEHDIGLMAGYVIHLSLRGEVEFNTIQTLLTKGELRDDSIAGHVEYWTKEYLKRWKKSNEDKNLRKPDGTPSYSGAQMQASILRGYKLFTDTEGAASCIGCHTDYGRQVNFRYDVWGTFVRPANLTTGVFRGGRRPIDLFWRVRGGIDPSGMPAAEKLKDDAVWDVVNFLQALPHPRMLPEEIRARIYLRDETKPADTRHAAAR